MFNDPVCSTQFAKVAHKSVANCTAVISLISSQHFLDDTQQTSSVMYVPLRNCSIRPTAISGLSQLNRPNALLADPFGRELYKRSDPSPYTAMSVRSSCRLHFRTVSNRVFKNDTTALYSQYNLSSICRESPSPLRQSYVNSSCNKAPLSVLNSTKPPRNTRSSSHVTLARPPTSSSLRITDRSFRYASPCLWNQLPSSLRQPHSSPSVSDFPAHAPATSSHSLNLPLSPSIRVASVG